jgi:hypothetical protein
MKVTRFNRKRDLVIVRAWLWSPRRDRQRSAIGKEQGWTLRVSRFSTLGFEVPNYRIHVFDLATGDDIDGLIGLSFLKQCNCEFRFTEGRIWVERAAVRS